MGEKNRRDKEGERNIEREKKERGEK
jgi:hypothetical protein